MRKNNGHHWFFYVYKIWREKKSFDLRKMRQTAIAHIIIALLSQYAFNKPSRFLAKINEMRRDGKEV